MNIGNKIYELRTSKNLSQGDLADKLDVSRQSISKWETDMAVPDLDKLMKICDLFEISLDELTGREQTNKTIDCNKETKGNTTVSAQKIIGYILFALSLIFGLIIFLFGTNEGDFIILPPIAFAMFICGLLCLFAGKNAFYWCVWTALAPITVLSPFVVGFSALTTLALLMVVMIIIMFFVANCVFKDCKIYNNKKKTTFLILLWILPIMLYLLHIYLLTISLIVSILLNFITYTLIAVLETYTVCYLKSLKKK